MKARPPFFERIRQNAEARWVQLEEDPELAGPWHQLFKQVQSPRHVLSELLQNADDAGATEASIQISEGCLIFEHNGEDFTEEHFASLCRFGYSNKRALHTIGFRGIGFKSTFSLGDTVELLTPSLSVAFDRHRFTAPRWNETRNSNINNTCVRVRISDENRKHDLEKNLNEWRSSPVSLLFFRSIRRLRLGEDDLSWRIVGAGPVGGSEWLELMDNPSEQFLLVRSAEEDFPEDALIEIRQERLLTSEQETNFPPCKVELVLGSEGRFFVVLPTGVETKLPFACNAPFIQDPSRLKIKDPSTSPTNRWLLERLGRLASSTMLEWLNKGDLAKADRCRAYGLIPDVNRDSNTLEGVCASLVETTFEACIDEQSFLLTINEELKRSGECVIYPEVLFQVWPGESTITLFDEHGRKPLSPNIHSKDRQKLVNWGLVDQIEANDVIDVLRANHLPKPESWNQLLCLWVYLAPLVLRYRYGLDKKEIKIVPTHGKNVLYSANEVVRLGEKRLLRTNEDWEFLANHLLFVNQNWTRFLTKQRRVAAEENNAPAAEEVENCLEVLNALGLSETSSFNKIIEQVTKEFFASRGLALAECIRFVQIAAKFDATVSDAFRFVTRKRELKAGVIFDSDGYLDLLFEPEWSEANLLHTEYTKQFTSCTLDEWNTWVSSGHAGLLGFAPLQKVRNQIYGREKVKTELRKRGFEDEPNFQFVTNDFFIDDWDFESRHWKFWAKAATEDKGFWGQIVERILSQPQNYWSNAKSVRVSQYSTIRSVRAITQQSVLPSWILKLREIACLRDTHGVFQKPADLLLRTPATESVMDVESFVHGSLDIEANRALLTLLGVRDVPTGPDHLLDRLRALAKADKPPIHEVEKWYQRLDLMVDSCSTDNLQNIKTAFQEEKIIFTERCVWTNTTGVFLVSDDDEIPGTEIVRSSVRNLTFWKKIGVAEQPTADLAIQWLKEIESDSRLSQDDTRRVKALLKRYPVRVWVECGHWLNLAGEWVSVETLLYSITRQSLVTWGNLHEWVKQKTADLLGLRGEVTSEPPFSTLDFLARKIENRLNQQSLGAGNPETRLWLNQLGIELSRIELDDQAETLRIRTLGNVLANTTWQTISRLEVVPYISGTPAGMPNHVDAVWLDEVLYAENRPLSKLANSVSQVIGNVFGNLSINDAVKLCFDRSPEFVSEYMEENFKLAPGPPMIIEPEENAILTVEGKIEDGPVERIVEPDAMPKFNANEHIDEDESDDDWETDVDFKDDELEDEDEPSRSRKRVKPPIMERYALVQGFKKEGEKRFYHSDGSWIAKTDDRSFPWEKRSASGELIHYYWPKDHCLEHSPLEMDTDVWHLIESYPDLYSLVLSDFRGEPVAVAGSKLKEMRKDGRLKFFSATYRLVYNSE